METEYAQGYQRAVEVHQDRPDAALDWARRILKRPLGPAGGTLDWNRGYLHGVLDSRADSGRSRGPSG